MALSTKLNCFIMCKKIAIQVSEEMLQVHRMIFLNFCLVMVDVCVETEIRDLSPKSFVPLPKEYWDNKKTTQTIFQSISAATDPSVKLEQVNLFLIFYRRRNLK